MEGCRDVGGGMEGRKGMDGVDGWKGGGVEGWSLVPMTKGGGGDNQG